MPKVDWKWFLIGSLAGYVAAAYLPKYLPMPALGRKA